MLIFQTVAGFIQKSEKYGKAHLIIWKIVDMLIYFLKIDIRKFFSVIQNLVVMRGLNMNWFSRNPEMDLMGIKLKFHFPDKLFCPVKESKGSIT